MEDVKPDKSALDQAIQEQMSSNDGNQTEIPSLQEQRMVKVEKDDEESLESNCTNPIGRFIVIGETGL